MGETERWNSPDLTLCLTLTTNPFFFLTRFCLIITRWSFFLTEFCIYCPHIEFLTLFPCLPIFPFFNLIVISCLWINFWCVVTFRCLRLHIHISVYFWCSRGLVRSKTPSWIVIMRVCDLNHLEKFLLSYSLSYVRNTKEICSSFHDPANSGIRKSGEREGKVEMWSVQRVMQPFFKEATRMRHEHKSFFLFFPAAKFGRRRFWLKIHDKLADELGTSFLFFSATTSPHVCPFFTTNTLCMWYNMNMHSLRFDAATAGTPSLTLFSLSLFSFLWWKKKIWNWVYEGM